MLIILFIAVLLLTYSNGANDNFKGVASVWGSGTLNYRQALLLATITTFAGSICSYFFAEELIKNFSGKGLVPDSIINSVQFVTAISLAAGCTVLIATKLGFPISTTHGLVGALVGAGLVASGSAVNFSNLGKTFFFPLLLSPLAATLAGVIIYSLVRKFKTKKEKPNGQNMIINSLHLISAGLVSFARGLNDTPKLISLLLLCNFFPMYLNVLILAVVMALGGILNAKKIAVTMSKKITVLSNTEGCTANMITAALVILASKFGLPVSTTHVSVGSIYGVGLVNKQANNSEIGKIALSWLLTLPLAALFAAAFYYILITIAA